MFEAANWKNLTDFYNAISYASAVLAVVIAIPEIPICGFPEIPFSPKSRNSGIFQAKIPEIRDFHFLHYLL